MLTAYESFNPTLLTRIFKSDKINNVVGNQFYFDEAAVKNLVKTILHDTKLATYVTVKKLIH